MGSLLCYQLSNLLPDLTIPQALSTLLCSCWKSIFPLIWPPGSLDGLPSGYVWNAVFTLYYGLWKQRLLETIEHV